jgi:hypothetical protein
MPLSLTQIPGGVHFFTYVGPIGVVGAPAKQTVDLTLIPKNVRESTKFREQIYTLWQALDANCTFIDGNGDRVLPAEGLPEELEVDVFSTDENAQVSLRLEVPHTIKR